ncbi:hypothetical protein I2I11_04985 [Pontibacter sp. 172403-2]|uniref:hypothetical protein n=1 Tax=Pontibacter rufus TaxID=2791028 RepID=UPI0018AFB2B5|nr:hypothetical protein [Pontibacter sp. 172403-2]MBF9252638.1 hypothetical protein [Pontibacter sp. 172403-2]
MRAIEFQTRLKDNQILIPDKIQSQLKGASDKDIRVMILIDDTDTDEEQMFSNMNREQFLKGYAASDSIYDTY